MGRPGSTFTESNGEIQQLCRKTIFRVGLSYYRSSVEGFLSEMGEKKQQERAERPRWHNRHAKQLRIRVLVLYMVSDPIATPDIRCGYLSP
jgi:hypothetical protein